MPYLYLASPYSHPEKSIREARFQQAEAATAWLLVRRHWVYSPIVHCHALAERFGLPTDFEFWQEYDKAMIEQAHELVILAIPGWEESKGIAGEIKIATACQLEITKLYSCPGGWRWNRSDSAQ